MTERYIPTRTVFATASEAMRAQARLFRNLGDEDTAIRWERQANDEEAYERSCQ